MIHTYHVIWRAVVEQSLSVIIHPPKYIDHLDAVNGSIELQPEGPTVGAVPLKVGGGGKGGRWRVMDGWRAMIDGCSRGTVVGGV